MQGSGRPNAPIQVSHAGIFRYLGQQRVQFESAQIQRIMRIICRSLLDSTVALSQKNTLIYYLHELNAHYGRRAGSVPRAAQFEILTCLVELCRILRTQLDSALAQGKQQEGAGAQGRGQDGLDDAPLFELGEQSLLQAARPYPAGHQGGGHGRERSSSSHLRPGEAAEPQYREVYGKVMWNLVASAELVFGIAREQRAQSEGGGSGTFLEPSELKVMKRLLIHGSEVIQGLAELRL
jgi:hypothetical protein